MKNTAVQWNLKNVACYEFFTSVINPQQEFRALCTFAGTIELGVFCRIMYPAFTMKINMKTTTLFINSYIKYTRDISSIFEYFIERVVLKILLFVQEVVTHFI